MSSATMFDGSGLFSRCFTFGTDIGPQPMRNDGSWGPMRLSTEPLGTCTLRLKNAIAGSEYGIFVQTTNSQATSGGVAAGVGVVSGTPGTVVDQDITLDYFVGGNANNDVRIRLRKGTSATKYQPFETLATLSAGIVLAYCAQVADTIA